ncbi:MAG: flagellar M-ring protein FliF [Rhodobacteraceae bacterium]|nr:flagellar M-ring protein FliF [Paracoccaceae bacterium]
MQQIRSVWAGLDRRKQIVVIGAAIAVFLSVFGLSRLASNPNMQLLYAGLESGSAGEVVRSLEQRGVVYEVRGGSIYVPSNQRDELRMTLASEGLPTNGGKGYELLDSLNGFGTTSQMFDAAYWRAKEGELARTIVANPHISQARVHIANTGSNPFQRSAKVTASVSVVPLGAPVTVAQATAIRHLVASAVAGLDANNVTVIDANGTVIGASEVVAGAATTNDDRAQVLKERVTRLVEARVGAGNAIVEVSVDTVTESESIREKRVDPASRVIISTDVEERSDNSTSQAGAVTVASNLPDGDAAEDEGSRASTSATRERINYEVSETELEIIKAPGAIRRLTVAVLVNGVSVEDANGNSSVQPRPEDELNSLRELVSAAVGFDDSRGDVITLKSMELPAVEPLGTAAEDSVFSAVYFDTMSLIQMAVLAVVSLILGLFVIRPIFSNAVLPAPSPAAALPSLQPEPERVAEGAKVLTGEIQTEDGLAPGALPAVVRDQASLPMAATEAENPVDRLRAMIGERQEETVEILRSWLEEGEEKVG